jgi:hypothetical protein
VRRGRGPGFGSFLYAHNAARPWHLLYFLRSELLECQPGRVGFANFTKTNFRARCARRNESREMTTAREGVAGCVRARVFGVGHAA